MKISVVICTTKDRKKQLKECLESLKKQTRKANEIIIDYTKPLIVSRNRGIDRTKGDIICFFDDDVIIDEHYLEGIDDFFTKRKDAHACSGRISNEKRMLYNNIVPVKIKHLFGCNMCFRRGCFDVVRFDETLMSPYTFDDELTPFNLRKAGFNIFYLPTVSVFHNAVMGGAGQRNPEKRFMLYKSFTINNYNLGRTWGWRNTISKNVFVLIRMIWFRDFAGMKGVFSGFKYIFLTEIRELAKMLKVFD